MKKLLTIIFSSALLLGCAQLKQGKVNFEECWNDTECREEAVLKSEQLSSKAAAIASVSPIPGTPAVVKSLVAGGSLIAFLIIGGAALQKKKEIKDQIISV